MIDQKKLAEKARLRIGRVTFKKNGCVLRLLPNQREACHEGLIDRLHILIEDFNEDPDLQGKLAGAALVVWTHDDLNRDARILLTQQNNLWPSDIPSWIKNYLTYRLAVNGSTVDFD